MGKPKKCPGPAWLRPIMEASSLPLQSQKQRPCAGKLQIQSKGLPAAIIVPGAKWLLRQEWLKAVPVTGVGPEVGGPCVCDGRGAAGGGGWQDNTGAAVFIGVLFVCVNCCGQWGGVCLYTGWEFMLSIDRSWTCGSGVQQPHFSLAVGFALIFD